eukprot:TRINITY_DN89_c0_g1_i2.p1 TRINITY_DN89_c0_g1~~TRINITY_DN89_c0_g1_i2.p1  ORF type:complete len:450 (-),score=95.97 TRINITY_DN89_c0_g1_i2:118-1467(-)
MQKKIGDWKRKFSDGSQPNNHIAPSFPGIPLHVEGDDFISVDNGKIIVRTPPSPHSDRPSTGVQIEEPAGPIPRSRSDGKTSAPAAPFPGIPLYAETKVINPIFAKAHPLLASRLDGSDCSRRNSIGGSRITASVSAPAVSTPTLAPPPPPKDPLEEDDELYEKLPAVALKSNVESGVYCTIGKRPRMEDVHVVYDNFREVVPDLLKDDQDYSFYAVYDGHGGREAAEKVEKHLHRCIVEDPAFAEGKVEEATRNGYFKADSIMLEEAKVEGWTSGAVVVTSLLKGNTLYIANAGDSEIILGRKMLNKNAHRAIVLSYKHRPTNADEKSRIEAEGGYVFHGRLYGTLAVSRALGDFEFKKPKSDGNFVSVEPALKTLTLKPVDEFVILACDGLWDKVGYQDAVNLVASKRAEGMTAAQIAQELVAEAVRRDSMDNVSAVVVFFKWEEKS